MLSPCRGQGVISSLSTVALLALDTACCTAAKSFPSTVQ